MKINSYKKKKLNTYELSLSNGNKIILYDDIILKYELLLKKEISNNLLEEIIIENSKYVVYYEAIKYISIKLRTEKELRKKFNNFDDVSVNYAIDRLKKEGYLNNKLYIKSYINDQINLSINGPLKIIQDLLKCGFNEREIKEYLDTIDDEVWLEKIEKYIVKKISTNRSYSGLILKKKISDDLNHKGYSLNLIKQIINNYDFIDNKEIYDKEYQKALKKYEKKYSGDILNLKTKNYLYQKGFRNY